MIAQRFRSIGWVAGCAAAALCCYLASQSVATERAALARVDREIASTEGEIRRLNTEIAARGRMGQIERWNTEVLALQAPAPGQFVADEVQLASLAGGKGLPLDPAIVASKGAVQNVAYQAPQQAAPAAAPEPMLRPATFVRPKPVVLEAPQETGIVKASFTRSKPFTLDLDEDVAAEPKPVARPKVEAKVKPVEAKGEPAPKTSGDAKKLAAEAKAEPAPKKKAATEPPLKKTVVADATPKKKESLATASLLPTDLGKLAAAEKKAIKSARVAGDR